MISVAQIENWHCLPQRSSIYSMTLNMSPGIKPFWRKKRNLAYHDMASLGQGSSGTIWSCDRGGWQRTPSSQTCFVRFVKSNEATVEWYWKDIGKILWKELETHQGSQVPFFPLVQPCASQANRQWLEQPPPQHDCEEARSRTDRPRSHALVQDLDEKHATRPIVINEKLKIQKSPYYCQGIVMTSD